MEVFFVVKTELEKISLAAILVALSIVLDIAFKQITFINPAFGFPYYALPLVIGSLVLGPFYGGIMGVLSDLIGYYAVSTSFPYDPLFALSAALWGIIPYFIANYRSKYFKVGLAILITHLTATLINSIALLQWTSLETFYATLWLRIGLLPVNVVILTFFVVNLNRRLYPLYDGYQTKKQIKSKNKSI